MYSSSRNFSFSYAHRLYRYAGKCSRLHGHNARVCVEIEAPEGELDANGMAIDFAKIKKIIGGWIDDELDHRVLLADDDPLADILKELGEPVVLFAGAPTSERIAQRIFDFATARGFSVVRVDFWESDNSRASIVR